MSSLCGKKIHYDPMRIKSGIVFYRNLKFIVFQEFQVEF